METRAKALTYHTNPLNSELNLLDSTTTKKKKNAQPEKNTRERSTYTPGHEKHKKKKK